MKTLLVILGILVAEVGLAGGRAGNGFAVHCERDPRLGLLSSGYYSLDYLSTLGMGASRGVKSWEESAERIERLLEGVFAAPLLESYRDFVKNVLNTDYTKKRVWEKAPFGVINLKKAQSLFGGVGLHPEQTKSNLQSLVSKLPPTCTRDGSVNFVPAVVFQDHGITGQPKGHVVYKYVPKVTEELESSNPLQLSYLYVHEWLWDISANEDRNRRINHFLHSERIESLSKEDIAKQLIGMGLVFTPPVSLVPKPEVGGGDFASAAAQQAYEVTQTPTDRLLTMGEIWLHQTSRSVPAFLWGNYELAAVERDCSGGVCGPWKVSDLVWSKKLDPNRVHPEFYVPPEPGEVWLRWDGNQHVLIKTPTVSRSPESSSTVILSCILRKEDTPPVSCNPRWMFGGTVLFGFLKPRGLFPEPKFAGGFYLDSGFWIGWSGKTKGIEMRMAFRAQPIKKVPHHRVRPEVDGE